MRTLHYVALACVVLVLSLILLRYADDCHASMIARVCPWSLVGGSGLIIHVPKMGTVFIACRQLVLYNSCYCTSVLCNPGFQVYRDAYIATTDGTVLTTGCIVEVQSHLLCGVYLSQMVPYLILEVKRWLSTSSKATKTIMSIARGRESCRYKTQTL